MTATMTNTGQYLSPDGLADDLEQAGHYATQLAWQIGTLDATVDWAGLGRIGGLSAARVRNEVLSLLGLRSASFKAGDDPDDVSITCIRQEDARTLVEAKADHSGTSIQQAEVSVFSELSGGDYRLDIAMGLARTAREAASSPDTAFARLFGRTEAELFESSITERAL